MNRRLPLILYNRKLLALLIISSLVWLYYYVDNSQHSSAIFLYFYDEKSIKCYRYKDETLPDISSVNIKNGKSIFFHETSCNSYINSKIVIGSRQACAVESAALLNPNHNVYLLYTSPGVFKFGGTQSDRFLQALLSYDNVNIYHLDYEKYVENTPVEELYSKGKIEGSSYAMSHASDVLRYLTLWKYGGIYLDLDIVVLKSFETLPPNFSGCESKENVAAGIMGFETLWSNETSVNGHKLAEECVMDLKDKFSGTLWGNNGPGVITRLVKKHCKVSKIKDAINKTCDDFKVFAPEYFYAIPWPSWREFFDEKHAEKVMKLTENSYIVHVWNKHSQSTQISIDSKCAYATFARKFCPKVFELCDNFF